MPLRHLFRSLLAAAALAAAAPAAPPPAAPPISEVGRQAFALVERDDLAGAVALLEPAVAAGKLGPIETALLGTLYVETGRAAAAVEVLAPLADRDDADAAVLYNAGRAHLALGQLARAEGYLARSVALVPRSPAARELGLLWGAAGRSLDAYTLLRPWALAHPDDREARIAAAALALRLERESEGAELVERMGEDDPKVAMLRGQILLQRGKPEEALSHLEPLLASAPPEMRPDLLRLLADVYITLGRSGDALALAPEGADGDPRLALLLATAHYRQGEIEAGAATLRPFAADLPRRRAAGEALGPLEGKLALEYGRLLVSTGKSPEAVPFLETATALLSDDASAWKSLGDALLGAGRREDALVARKKFQEMSARQNELRREAEGQRAIADPVARSLAQAQDAAAAGEGDRALEILRREIRISPDDLRPRLAEVTTLLELDRKDEALARSEAIRARFPDHPDAVYLHGVVALARGQREAAEADLRRTLELAPGHVAALNDLAVLLMLRGEKAEAQRLLERVLELRPEDAKARANLESLRQPGG